jgi:hypothetical protein
MMMMMMMMIIIVIKNKKDKTCLLIDVAIPSDKNVIQKSKLKLYKNLTCKYRNSENVEYEMLCHTSNHWSHRNYKKKFTKNIWKQYQYNTQ